MGSIMEKFIGDYLAALELGKPQQHENMTVIPLYSPTNHGPEYMTLPQALKDDLVAIGEVHAGGSVPEVRVLNRAPLPVLLVDGEELAGAKQNRILNTSILVREKAETLIPVSCTEQGRWGYTTEAFGDSGHISPPKMRYAKQRSVTESLKRLDRYASDQGEVWGEVGEMMFSSESSSSTSAMRDVYVSRGEKLKGFLEAFTPQEKQRGLVVLIGGEVAGLDVVSREAAYASLHEKFIKGYALDALLDSKRTTGKNGVDQAEGFIQAVLQSDEQSFESVGYGRDYRFHAAEVKAVGQALAYQEKVIHASFVRRMGSHDLRHALYMRSRRR